MCLTPITIRQGQDNEATVPCSRCAQCYARRISGWSFRLMMEYKRSISAHFITLTYATRHLQRSPNNFPTLEKRECQLFFKRLRKANTNRIKYYVCGEYGTHNRRPHYHAIVFNCSLSTYMPAWNKGSIYYGSCTAASVGYVLKYMSKGKSRPLHKRDDRVPEFSLMSKRMGSNYLTDAMIMWHHADLENRMYCTVEDNKKISMPRYFKDKIYGTTGHWRDIVKNAAADRVMQKQMEERIRYEHDDNYWKNKYAAIRASFGKLHYSSSQNRNL
ncbi:MAG: replication initiator protein [Microvirus sp.]|nr:MAG: replication initiator protein [Microvirus sp.]